MAEFANLEAFAEAGPKRRRSQRPLANGIYPTSPADCAGSDLYFRRGGSVRSTTIPFLGGRIARKGYNRRATCARYPEQNAWVDAVKALTDQVSGLSAAEAASLLKRSGIWPTGSAETNPSKSPEYRRANRVKSPSHHVAGPAIDVSAAAALAGRRLSPRRARSL